MSSARYAVGIDLGTTHCVMSAVDLTQDESGWRGFHPLRLEHERCQQAVDESPSYHPITSFSKLS